MTQYLYNNINHIYFIDNEMKTNYRESLFYHSPNRLGSVYDIKHFVLSIISLSNIPIPDKFTIEYMNLVKRTIKYILSMNVNAVEECKEYFNDIALNNSIDVVMTNIDVVIIAAPIIRNLIKVLNEECPICLDVKDDIHQGHFKCCHHICDTCFDLLPNKTCCLCRTE
jgi:hypothetical protein